MIFTVAFWKKTFEAMVVTFGSVLAGTGVFTGGTPTLHSVYAALISAGVASLYVLAKAIGNTEAVQAMRGQHAAPEVKNQF